MKSFACAWWSRSASCSSPVSCQAHDGGWRGYDHRFEGRRDFMGGAGRGSLSASALRSHGAQDSSTVDIRCPTISILRRLRRRSGTSARDTLRTTPTCPVAPGLGCSCLRGNSCVATKSVRSDLMNR